MSKLDNEYLKKNYSSTITFSSLSDRYYRWNKSNQKKIPNKNFDWNGCFDEPDYIGLKKSGSGYVYPNFHFLQFAFTHSEKTIDHDAPFNDFGLSKDKPVPPEKIILIQGFKDSLLAQLKRQAVELKKIDREIANVLKVYYYETEQAILEQQITDDERDKILLRLENTVKNIFKNYIQRGIDNKHLEKMLNNLPNKFVSEYLFTCQKNGILYLNQTKQTSINTALEMMLKIVPMEGILSKAFMGKIIISDIEFRKGSLTKSDIIQKAHDLKNNGMNVENMFLEMKNWLLTDVGFTNDELQYTFGFQFHEHEEAHHTFNKFVNKNRP